MVYEPYEWDVGIKQGGWICENIQNIGREIQKGRDRTDSVSDLNIFSTVQSIVQTVQNQINSEALCQEEGGWRVLSAHTFTQTVLAVFILTDKFSYLELFQ